MSGGLAGARIGLLTAAASRLGGGVFEAVVAQAQIITACGGTPIVFALADPHSADDRERFGAVQVEVFRVSGPGQIGYAPQILAALLGARLDCLHLHGIWMYPSRAGAGWAKASGRGYVISPHGMLDPWITARGRWKKALARVGYEREGWRRASFLHGLTAAESADIARETGRGDSAVIANAAPPISVSGTRGAARAPHLAYIGRIHPKKNLLALVEAWTLTAHPSGSRLTIAGWGEPSDIAALEAAVAAAGPGVRFVGPVYGLAKQALLAEAKFMVLPSLSEGLPMAVLEGWAAGTPTVMTAACNLPEGFTGHAAIECGTSPDKLIGPLEQALGLDPADWQAMSQNAQVLAAGQFSADTVAARWGETYLRAIALGAATA